MSANDFVGVLQVPHILIFLYINIEVEINELYS